MNRSHPLRAAAAAAALGAALWLAGCAAPAPVPPPHVPPPVSAAPMPPPPSPASPASPSTPSSAASGWAWSARMDAAAQRLRDQLGGSAEVAQTTDQRLWISLPNDQAFPPGRSAVTKPAGAWLDQVAVALRGLPQAEVQIVGQPDGQTSNTSLALDRAASARDWMVMRGVPARRVAVSGQATKGKAKTAENRLDILIGERGVPVGSPSR
jgi:outer membrane protein OmpA-like peptidoglycan-associated protein